MFTLMSFLKFNTQIILVQQDNKVTHYFLQATTVICCGHSVRLWLRTAEDLRFCVYK